MKRWTSTLLLMAFASVAQAGFGDFSSLPSDPRLTAELERIAGEILTEFASAKLTEGNFAMTLIDLSSGSASRASYRGDLPFFTASVVKLYLLVVAHDQLARGTLEMSSELDRALRDMIVESSNDATSYVVDRITGTTSGEELSGRALRRFTERRREINRYFDRLGYSVSVMLKVWCEGPYGRDKVIMGPNLENRNRITSDQTAALMLDIITGRAVSRRASDQMLTLMRRTVTADGGTDGQVKGFTGEPLPAGSRLWSKAGWTSEVRHDATYVELPNGKKYVLVVCTRWAAQELRLLPEVSRRVVALFESGGR